jgi:hypothetical protein
VFGDNTTVPTVPLVRFHGTGCPRRRNGTDHVVGTVEPYHGTVGGSGYRQLGVDSEVEGGH